MTHETELLQRTARIETRITNIERALIRLETSWCGVDRPGICTRVDRLEQTELQRRRQLAAIWSALVSIGVAVIGSIGMWWLR